MSTPQPASSERVATVLHASLTGGVLLILVVGLSVRSLIDVTPLEDLAGAAVAGAVVAAVALLMVVRFLRGAIRPLEAGDDPAGWWSSNLPRAVVLWAAAEATSLLGLVAYVLTASLVALGILAGIGFTVLVVNRPSQLREA